jgi:hypothetical protein
MSEAVETRIQVARISWEGPRYLNPHLYRRRSHFTPSAALKSTQLRAKQVSSCVNDSGATLKTP